MISLKQLTKYCRDYIDLVAPSVLSRDAKKVILPKDILDATSLYTETPDVDYESLTLTLNVEPKLNDLDLDSDDATDRIGEEDNESIIDDKRKIEIARKLDEINRKYETSSYTKQITLRFGRVNFSAKPITESGDSQETGEIYKEVEQHLFSVPVTISYKDSGGLRHYQLLVDDSVIATNTNFLKEFLPQEQRDEIFRLVSQSEAAEKTSIPLNHDYVDELWAKIRWFLIQSGAKEISEMPDMENTSIILLPKANYFLSQDLMGIIEAAEDDDMLTTSLSAWIDDVDMSINEPMDDNGERELFFPFPYDRSQLQVLGKIDNKAGVVEGPPGTGKSQTIANILCHLAATGQKVLFVSQKDQAVRGVKDKLKSLDIPYLFGYLPDRSSRLHSEEDDRDSAAYALKGIAQAHFRQQVSVDPKQWLSKLYEERPKFDAAMSLQRDYVALFEERASLDAYDFGPDALSINEPWLDEIASNNIAIHELSKAKAEQESVLVKTRSQIKDLESSRDSIKLNTAALGSEMKAKTHYEWLDDETTLLRSLTYSDVATSMSDLTSSFEEHVHDRKANFIQSKLRSIRLSKDLNISIDALPREMYESVKEIVFADGTKTERYKRLTEIQEYFAKKAMYADKYRQLETTHKAATETASNCSQQLQDTLQSISARRATMSHLILDDNSMERVHDLIGKDGMSAIKLIHRRHELDQLVAEYKSTNPNEINEQIKREKHSYEDSIRSYLGNRLAARANEYGRVRQYRAALESIGRKLAKSKKAYKTFDTLKSNPFNFEAMSGMIPIWMMGLDDASRVLPLAPNIFDYLIIDEASQCNISYALPAMYRSKHTIFFGDTLQMRDTTTIFKSNETLVALANKHSIPEDLQIKADEDSVKSVMDIAKLSGFQTTWLQNHYRSPKELIGFSNEWFYAKEGRRLQVINDDLLLMSDGRVLKNHVIAPNPAAEISDLTNLTEAVYIKKLIADIKADPTTKDKSIAVLTFFNPQAELLRRVILDEDVKISAIEGIQGDERDIVIYSFVIRSPDEKNRYTSLTGEGGEIKASVNAGRVNVAFSRARLQVHTVTSLSPILWPEKIWIKRYLEYVEEHGRVRRLPKAEQHFDSKFEEHVYDYLANAFDSSQYSLHTQVESCGFKIDLVLNNLKTGKKLAIECDGPTHFEAGDGQVRVESDYERQYVLETAGWRFYRISYTDWQGALSEAKRDLMDFIKDYMKSTVVSPEAAESSEEHVYEPEVVDVPTDLVDSLRAAPKTERTGAFGRKIKAKDTSEPVPSAQMTISENKVIESPIAKDVPEEVAPSIVDDSSENSAAETGAFDLLGEVRLSEKRAIVISKRSDGTFWLNEKLNTDTFKGFTAKGFGIPPDELDLFISALSGAITKSSFEMSFPRTANLKLIVHTPDEQTVDIRYYKTSAKYTGYMKKGLRVMKPSAEKILKALESISATANV